LPIDVGYPLQPMPCGVTKPPTRLLVLLERLPMARHRPAIASTGTAPDRRQLLPNFSAVCEPMPAQSTGAVPFHRDPTSPAYGCAGTFLRTPPVLPTGATVSRYTRPLQNRPAPAPASTAAT